MPDGRRVRRSWLSRNTKRLVLNGFIRERFDGPKLDTHYTLTEKGEQLAREHYGLRVPKARL
jgi:DNA-binding MarR family transcriptional regulator